MIPMTEIRNIVRGIAFMIVGSAFLYGTFLFKPTDTLIYFLIGLGFSGILCIFAGLVLILKQKDYDYMYTQDSKKINWM